MQSLIKSLRKGTAGVWLTYQNGGFTNNLHGDKFQLYADEGFLWLEFDLTRNLQVRNKASNCYYDAQELREKRTTVKSFQIEESAIREGLKNIQRHSDKLKLKVRLGESLFTYKVDQFRERGLFFDVTSES